MTSILNHFEICAKIPENIKTNIKLFHVFNDSDLKKNIIFITNDQKVYGLGHNGYGVLGVGNGKEVEECTEIKEVSNKKMKEFFIGVTFVLGLNENNDIFMWGYNYWAQLGRGYRSGLDECLKPARIEFQTNEKIEDISCGLSHTLVLTLKGRLYGWGRNNCGQLGLHNEESVDKPTKLIISSENLLFKYIYCCIWSSFAITTTGQVYSWGVNRSGVLGQGMNDTKCIPRGIDLTDVQKIGLGERNSYFLTNEGSIYFCGEYKVNQKICNQNTLHYRFYTSLGLSKMRYKIDRGIESIKTFKK